METLSAPASRMTGYPGAAVAREWLVAELEGLGIAEIYRHEFPVLVPMDEGILARMRRRAARIVRRLAQFGADADAAGRGT